MKTDPFGRFAFIQQSTIKIQQLSFVITI